jgi:hypothetical protein
VDKRDSQENSPNPLCAVLYGLLGLDSRESWEMWIAWAKRGHGFSPVGAGGQAAVLGPVSDEVVHICRGLSTGFPKLSTGRRRGRDR